MVVYYTQVGSFSLKETEILQFSHFKSVESEVGPGNLHSPDLPQVGLVQPVHCPRFTGIAQ